MNTDTGYLLLYFHQTEKCSYLSHVRLPEHIHRGVSSQARSLQTKSEEIVWPLCLARQLARRYSLELSRPVLREGGVPQKIAEHYKSLDLLRQVHENGSKAIGLNDGMYFEADPEDALS